jgi:hypothetical protein
MKNMKKLLAGIAAALLIAALIVPSDAAPAQSLGKR